MSGELVATEALVLRRYDFSETSQVGHLFTREAGRLSVLAKGIKRGRSELRGPMDHAALVEIEVSLRPAKRGDPLHLLRRYRVITGWPGARRDPRRLWAGFYLTEVLHAGTRDLDPDPRLFDFAVATLEALDGATPREVLNLVAWFELGFLGLAGFLPDFARCTTCGREAPLRGPVRFAPALGGLLCRGCAQKRPARTLALDAAARAAIAGLLAAGDAGAAAALPVGRATQESLRAALPRILEHVLEREIRSAGFVGVEVAGCRPYGDRDRASSTA